MSASIAAGPKRDPLRPISFVSEHCEGLDILGKYPDLGCFIHPSQARTYLLRGSIYPVYYEVERKTVHVARRWTRAQA
jgi:hypothetical protein